MSYLSVNLEILQRDREIPFRILRDWLLVKIPRFHSFCQLYKFPKIQCLLESAVMTITFLKYQFVREKRGFLVMKKWVEKSFRKQVLDENERLFRPVAEERNIVDSRAPWLPRTKYEAQLGKHQCYNKLEVDASCLYHTMFWGCCRSIASQWMLAFRLSHSPLLLPLKQSKKKLSLQNCQVQHLFRQLPWSGA